MGRLAQEHVKWLQARPSVGNAVWKAETGENKKIENVTLAVSLVSPVFRIWRESECWPLQIVSRARSLALTHVCTDGDGLLNSPTPPPAPHQKEQLLILKGVSSPKKRSQWVCPAFPLKEGPCRWRWPFPIEIILKWGRCCWGFVPLPLPPPPTFIDQILMLLIKLQKL